MTSTQDQVQTAVQTPGLGTARSTGQLTRRHLVVSAPLFIPATALGLAGAVPPSDRINVAGLGIGGRGERDLESFLVHDDVQFRAICDARNERREEIKSKVDKHHGNSDCTMYDDMYDLWARDDIDAVLIATGDRWHTLLSILTAKSGKDVYCEKPCSMTIAESRMLADTYHRLGRVYQAGTQRRNGTNFEYCINLARDGSLGEIRALHANAAPGDRYTPLTTHDWLPAEPQPPKSVVDWDRWLGPAPWRPYNSLYVKSRWRGFFDFHGGGILEWGSHTLDLCHAAAGLDETAPTHYRPVRPEGPTPYGVECKYANGIELVLRDTGWDGLGSCAVRFEGDDGWVQTGDAGIVEASDSLSQYRKKFEDAREATTRHVRDFLNCVKSRKDTRANALAACQTHVACHAAYIAYQVGEELKFDPATDTFIGNDKANRMRSRAMREPWRLT